MSENSVQTEEGSDASTVCPPTVGSRLRSAREAKGLSISDVAETLKLGAGQVEALENNHWQALPGLTFIRGFVRNYGRLVGLDPEQLMQELKATLDIKRPDLVLPESTHVAMPEPAGRVQKRDYALPSLGLVLVILAVLIYFLLPDDLSRLRSGVDSILQSLQGVLKPLEPPMSPTRPAAHVNGEQPALPPGSTVNQVLAPDTTEPSVEMPLSAEAGQVAPSSVNAPVRLSFTEDSWVEVRDRNGNVLFSQIGVAGNDKAIDGSPPFSLVIGNAKGVKVIHRGVAVDLTPYLRGDVARLSLE
ncbi:MAG: Cytoskeleton protein RodZ [Betaproteobacteria bacterium ADurb.Bin341]|nr:MAG: Cytoskeleton protein RodZ [Betaproteobacteria bacterium ADurb.Bin341]